jgi:predicted MFS family arabinose efflux permease
VQNPLSLYGRAFLNIQRNVWILSVALFINRSGSMVLLFTSLYLTNELKFSLALAGVVMSFYGLGSILGSFAGGWLTDRYNFFDVMVASLFTSGIILPFLLLGDTLHEISLVIFLYAFTADMFRPAMSKGIAFYSTPENRTRSIALIRLAINLGFSVGPAIGGFVAYYLGYRPLIIMDACTSALAGIMLVIYLPRKPVLKETPQTQTEPLQPRYKSAYSDYIFLFFIALVALYGMCFFQLFASVPQYLDKVWHYSEDHIGWILALNGILVVAIEMPLMVALEKKKKIFHFIIAGAICVPIAFLMLYLGHGMIVWIVVYTLIITMSEIFCMPFMMNFSLSRPAKERQGQYAALYSIAYGIANIGAPLLGLGVADRWGFEVMFYVLVGTSALMAVGFIILNSLLEKNTPENENLIDD